MALSNPAPVIKRARRGGWLIHYRVGPNELLEYRCVHERHVRYLAAVLELGPSRDQLTPACGWKRVKVRAHAPRRRGSKIDDGEALAPGADQRLGDEVAVAP